ncbi:GumC family protein [Sphingobium algorifonticola]|nr:polysaccharide biosynthesis tyrosine autokinase [Sphingobium algorifonticola]
MTFEQIFAICRRMLPFALIGGLLLGALAAGYSLIAPRKYEAVARVIVEPRTLTLTASQDVMSALPQRDPTVVDTEVEFLQSLAVAEQVVRDQKLVSDPEFGDTTPEKTAVKFQSAMSVRRAGPTYLIDIGVESRSPQRAAELANAAATAYTNLQRSRKRDATTEANKLLASRVESMAEELRKAEDAVQRYRISNGLMSVNGATLAEQTAAQLSQQLADARARERAALAELGAARGANVSLDSANSQMSLGTLRAQQATAQQEMSAAASRYGPNHPQYIAAAERLAQINQAVASESGRARSAVAADRQTLVADLAAKAAAASNLRRSLESSAGVNDAGLTRNSRASSDLGKLERNAAALRSTYEAYLERYQQTSTQLGTEQADSSLVAAALVPGKPSKPDLKLNVIVGVVLGIFGGISVATMILLFESHFSTSQQVEESLDVDSLPSLPSARSANLSVGGSSKPEPAETAAAMLAAPTDTFAEMHKSLLASLNRPVDGKPNTVVMISSALPREGKTTAAICLAAMAAHIGRKVVLVDCDQRRRTTTQALIGEPKVGVGEVIDGAARLDDALVQTILPGLTLLPASSLPTSAVDIFERTAGVERMIAALRARFDLILIDTAPLLPIADSRVLAKHADSVMLLCRWRATPRRAVEQALELLAESDAPIAGVALVQVDLQKQATFGYGDKSFYYNKYKEYYHSAS